MQNFKSPPRHIKLDKHVGMPSLRTLEDMRQKVNANAGATVELPFGNESQTLILTVSREVSKGSWNWMLYVDEGFGSMMDWSYVTPDANYIHGLIGKTHPGLLVKSRPGSVQDNSLTPTQEPVVKVRKGTLEGNLKNIQITNLLQSVGMGQMTGRLEIISASDKASVLFINGKPVHASLRGADGNEALIQLFAWLEGEFSFYDEAVTITPTINRGLMGLMMEGTTFVDHYVFLKEHGLSHEAYPIKQREIRSAAEMSPVLKNGIECDLALQWSIFGKINGTSTWADIERTLSEKKTEWVPVLFNLLTNELIRFDSEPAGARQAAVSRIDWSIVQGIKNTMCRADTGLCTYAALLYSLEQEYYRYESLEVPFSLIVFGFCDKYSESQDSEQSQFIPLKTTAINELREKVFRTKRKYDLLSHYGAFSYAVVLPFAVKDNAKRFAEILAEICADIAISEGWDHSRTEFRAGIACIPVDCRTPDEMIAIAERVRPLTG
jgi:hypothetical protein